MKNLDQKIIEKIVYAATLAPSGHNTQPWEFVYDGDSLILKPDFKRRLPVVDPSDRALFISLGAALENLVVAARENSYEPVITYKEIDSEDAFIKIQFVLGNESLGQESLYEAISIRRSNRFLYDGKPLPIEKIDVLAHIECERKTGVSVISDLCDRQEIIDLVLQGDEQQFSNLDFKRELRRWVRFNRREIEESHDGLSFESTGNPSSPRWLGSLILRMTTPKMQTSKDKLLLESSSAFAVFWSEGDSREDWLASGRTFERFALKATTLDIQQSHMNQAVEEPSIRQKFRRLSLLNGKWPQLILRLGNARPAPRTSRRPVPEVLQIH